MLENIAYILPILIIFFPAILLHFCLFLSVISSKFGSKNAIIYFIISDKIDTLQKYYIAEAFFIAFFLINIILLLRFYFMKIQDENYKWDWSRKAALYFFLIGVYKIAEYFIFQSTKIYKLTLKNTNQNKSTQTETVQSKVNQINNNTKKTSIYDAFNIPINLLVSHNNTVDYSRNYQQEQKLIEVLNEFGISGEIFSISVGPVITLYEFKPVAGTKSSRVIGLADDIARSLSAISVRIAIIPGKNAIGIEIPNKIKQTVYIKPLIEKFDSNTNIPIALGSDISGNPVIADLAKMPHLLVAGTTGSGKSVGINAMIMSILFRFSPEECKLILIDPKMLELSIYEGIPHLLSPVVTENKKAISALKWTIHEMEKRYRLMANFGVRNLEAYNKMIIKKSEITREIHVGFDDSGKEILEKQTIKGEKMPFIVLIIDEMADLMITAGKEVESSIQRLAQMARAAGIHIIMATQRPSVDVITGLIKANFPTRISFRMRSSFDSKTILGERGAEQLLGAGDMLYMSGSTPQRIHAPFVSDSEVEAVVNYLKSHYNADYKLEFSENDTSSSESQQLDEDPLFSQAVNVIKCEDKVSISYLQRKFGIGYNRSAKIVEMMEEKGIVSKPDSLGRRKIL